MRDIDTFRECIAAYAALGNSRCQDYADVLARAVPILAQMREQDRLRPPNFNIFQALGRPYREVSTHSAMLAHLLDPAGSHGQRALFLSEFLKIVQTAANTQKKKLQLPRPENPAAWRCSKEVPLPDGLGKVDVLLCGPGLLLVIENKIFAGDPEKQLQRYWEFAKREAERKRLLPVLVYLTPDGRQPNSQSVGDSTELKDHLVLLSYHEDIHQFIQRNAEEIQAVAPVAEVLRQYAALVSRLI